MSVAQILNSVTGTAVLTELSSEVKREMDSRRAQIICACGAVRVYGVPA